MVSIIYGILLVLTAKFGLSDGSQQQFPEFGRSMLSKWDFDSNFIQLNHASYGPAPNVVHEALFKCELKADKHIDLWQRRAVIPELARVRSQIGQLISADPDDIVLVPSGSSAFNSILNSISFRPGDRILHLSTIYMSVNAIVNYILDRSNKTLSTVVFEVKYPTSNEKLVKDLEIFLNKIDDPKRPIRIALFEHITAMPSVVNPIEKIIPLLKQRNIPVAIDGAHAIGNIPVNITALDPDFYTNNLHKWLYVERPSVMLYVKKKHQGNVHPAIISNFYRQPSDFHNEFYWTGSMDYCPYMTISTALEFRRNLGGEDVIRQYTNKLAWEGGNLIASRLGTRMLQTKDQMASMANVQLPLKNPDDPKLTSEWWVDKMLYEYPNIFVPVFKHDGQWWARIAAQIYNELSDFEACAKHLEEICNDVNSGKLNIEAQNMSKKDTKPTDSLTKQSDHPIHLAHSSH